jgi:uncharacterized protein YggE
MDNNTSVKTGWKSPWVALAILGMLLLAGIIIVSIIRERIVSEQQWQINVIGQGKVTYQPDTANITMGVQIDKAAKADEALNQLNDKMNKIYQAIEKLGVAKQDIQTQNYSLSPVYDSISGETKPSGYNANQLLIVKVKDIQSKSDMISKIISEASKAGINQINGVSFEASNLNELKQEARLKAIADARSKAGNISTALGVKLKKVVGWWENIISPEGQYYYDGGKGGMGGGIISAEPTTPSGDKELIIEVNLNYSIK